MSQAYSAVVPSSMERPKRIAKRLHQIYPMHPLSQCQAVVSQLYFHQDWHALEQAVKAGLAGGPFLEELSSDPKVVIARYHEQVAIVGEELGGVNWDADYSPPTDSTPWSTSARESQARGRYNTLMAKEAVAELMPTARTAFPKQEYPAFTPLSDAAIVGALPKQLSKWWSVNIPLQDVVAKAWASMEVNPHCRVSLLRAAHYWGTLCMHYANTISPRMVMGVTFLFATRYATICLHGSKDAYAALDALDAEGASEETMEQARRSLDTLFIEEAGRLMDTLSRDDLPVVFRAQPNAFITNAEACLKILSNPRSKRGTTRDDR